MYYKSTRNSEVKVSSAQAIAQGISVDGGLFVPEEIPSISMEDLKKLGEQDYRARAKFVFGKFLTDLFQLRFIVFAFDGFALNFQLFDLT